MFTGIIKAAGTVRRITTQGTNKDFLIESSLTPQLTIDQSVAHNGVCLTVTAIEGDCYSVTAIDETLQKTTLGSWSEGQVLNLELALRAGDRMDGHFVQGHVDGTGTCISKEAQKGSWLFRFTFAAQFAPLVIEKGSICIDGVSLTCFNLSKTEFSVAIIPYTYEHTTFSKIEPGTPVNLEFDVMGKYLLRQQELGK